VKPIWKRRRRWLGFSSFSTPTRVAAKTTSEVASLTLEAMRLYEKSGFELGEESTLFMTRKL